MRWRSRTAARRDLEFVFVMTYGRSGSTLLMGLLNSIPGYLIRGENRHALRHLYEFHRNGLVERARVNPRNTRSTTHPWFGIHGFDEEASLRGVRDLAVETLLRPEPTTRVTGFKEIRWYDQDLDQYVDFLRAVFPGARFVVNTRHLPDVAASAFWRQKEDPLGRLEEIERRMLAVADGLGEAAHRVHYDDYRDDAGALRGLFDWLGEPFDQERIARTLSVPHSVKPRS